MDYIKLINDSKLSREYTLKANQTIIQDLFDKNLRGSARMRTLDFFEDEEAFSRSGGFIPGCFYIFRHDGEILRNADGKEFHDVIPVFLCLAVLNTQDNEGPSIFGINFNILTKPIRAAILQELYKADKKFFDTVVSERFKGRHQYSQVLLNMFVADKGTRFCEYICDKYKIKKTSIAFRRYFIKNISKMRLIDYWQWKYLPFLNIKDGVRGYQLAKLQKENIN